jgi:hypothetical protein
VACSVTVMSVLAVSDPAGLVAVSITVKLPLVR